MRRTASDGCTTLARALQSTQRRRLGCTRLRPTRGACKAQSYLGATIGMACTTRRSAGGTADQGDANTQLSLDAIHVEGKGVAKDLGEAARLFQLAADQGM